MIRGGLRSRLVIDSVRFAMLSTLQQHGWLDATIHDNPPGVRRHQPFRYIPRPVEWEVEIVPNAIAISAEDSSDTDLALGGEVEDHHVLYADIFAEDDSVGWQVAYDIRDALLGRDPSHGTAGPQIDIYDFRQPTPAPFTTVDIDIVRVDRSQGETRDWQRHWFIIYLTVEDDYADEFDPAVQQTAWSAGDQVVVELIRAAESSEP